MKRLSTHRHTGHRHGCTHQNLGARLPLSRATEWLNSPPLTAEGLQGRVVLVQFWTYSCINWLRTMPYVRAWAEKYRDRGLVVIGVHSPEFGFEQEPGQRALGC